MEDWRNILTPEFHLVSETKILICGCYCPYTDLYKKRSGDRHPRPTLYTVKVNYYNRNILNQLALNLPTRNYALTPHCENFLTDTCGVCECSRRSYVLSNWVVYSKESLCCWLPPLTTLVELVITINWWVLQKSIIYECTKKDIFMKTNWIALESTTQLSH